MGLGFRRGVKPEVLFPGGREHVPANTTHAPIEVRPTGSPNRFFGIKAASPGAIDQVRAYNGTSVATALATHGAIRVFEALKEMPSEAIHPRLDEEFAGVVLKTLLVHAARWDEDATETIKSVVNADGAMYHLHERDEISRIFGYGKPDIGRVLECTEKRATLVGWGTIQAGEASQFRVPLPPTLPVSVTIAWLTPINVNHRMYRMAKLEASPGGDDKLSLNVKPGKQQPSHIAVARGTVFHRCWDGTKAAEFVDDGYLVLDITCKATAGELDAEIPYGVAVTLEVGEGVAIPVYQEIQERLRSTIRTAVRASV
ncbi:MAG: S8 family serine peptidase [Polyangiaceae bacterium]|jgi:hypothetical protein